MNAISTPILIVDDYHTTIRIVRTLLRRLGFADIDDARSGREALDKLRSREYGLVISDYCMQPMSGMELLSQARAEAKTEATPFLLLANDASEREDALRRATASILKPFSSSALKASLAPLFGAL